MLRICFGKEKTVNGIVPLGWYWVPPNLCNLSCPFWKMCGSNKYAFFYVKDIPALWLTLCLDGLLLSDYLKLYWCMNNHFGSGTGKCVCTMFVTFGKIPYVNGFRMSAWTDICHETPGSGEISIEELMEISKACPLILAIVGHALEGYLKSLQITVIIGKKIIQCIYLYHIIIFYVNIKLLNSIGQQSMSSLRWKI